MKITERFQLGVSQFEIDFVDIDTDIDTPLFIDPFFLATRSGPWAIAASRTIRNFFETFVNVARAGNLEHARELFDYLHEPNETCLGMSRADPQGRAIGEGDADRLFESVLQSRAIETGVIEDLEDFRIFIPGIDKDKVSDMTTNIIRRHLIDYTAAQCALWEIELQQGVASEFYWSAPQRAWTNAHVEALVIDGRKILLTPKSIVSFVKRYTPQTYYRHFVLEFLRHEHLRTGGSLVRHRKNGDPYVTKKSIQETEAPFSKEFLAGFTATHPEVFHDFKDWAKENSPSTSNAELSTEDPSAIAAFLIHRLGGIEAGPADASRYHRWCVSALELILYPDVTTPTVEQEINEGRKRIDIVFDNAAVRGFFFRIHTVSQIPAQFIFVECKNYTKEVANPELDQLNGRFSVNHGKVGLLLFRTIDDERTLLMRCRDLFLAQQHLLIPISDGDIMNMLREFGNGNHQAIEGFFSDRYRSISLGNF